MSEPPLPPDVALEPLSLLAADLDDESPETLAASAEHLLAHGALDVSFTSLQMKKGRPGVRVEVLTTPERAEGFVALLLRETRTLGVRRQDVTRYALARRVDSIAFRGETVRVKVALWDGTPLKAKAELEDLRAVAGKTGLPLLQLAQEAEALLQDLLRAR